MLGQTITMHSVTDITMHDVTWVYPETLFSIIYNFLTCTWLVDQSVGGFVCLCVCLSDMGDLSQQV